MPPSRASWQMGGVMKIWKAKELNLASKGYKRFSLPATFSLSALLAACGGGSGGGQTTPPAPPPPPAAPPPAQMPADAIVIASGPVVQAEVFIDRDGDLVPDTASQQTDASGGFMDLGEDGPFIARGGIDTFRGVALDGITLSAPASAEIISPLTTLIDRGGLSQDQLKAALMIPETVDLLTFDPLVIPATAESLAVNAASDLVLSYIVPLGRLFSAAGRGDGLEDAIDFLANIIATGETRLGNTSVLGSFLNAESLALPDWLDGFAQGYILSFLEDFFAATVLGNVPTSIGATRYALTQFLDDLDRVFQTTSEEDFQDLLDEPDFNFLGANRDFTRFANGLPTQDATIFTQPDLFEAVAGQSLTLQRGDYLANDILQAAQIENDVTNAEVFFSSAPNLSLSFDDTTDVISITPQAGSIGEATLFYTVTPPQGPAATGIILLNIIAPPDPLEAVDDDFTVPNNQRTVIDVTGNDIGASGVARVNGQNLRSDFFFDLPSGARVANINGQFTYDPNDAFAALGPGETAVDTFTYLIVGSGGQSTAMVTINVEGIRAPFGLSGNSVLLREDTAPILTNGTITLSDGGAVDPITITSFEGVTFNVGRPIAGQFGSLDLEANGDFVYRLNPATIDAAGLGEQQSITDSFTFTGLDPLGNVIVDEVRITLEGVNDPPNFIIGTASGAVTATLSQTATDMVVVGEVLYITTIEGDLLRLEIETGEFLDPIALGTQLSSITVDPSQTFLYVGEREPITFMADDQNGLSGEGTAGVYQIRLSDLNTQLFDVSISGEQRGIIDIAALSAGQVMISYDSRSTNRLSQSILDPSTGAIADVDNVNLGPLIASARDGSLTLIQNETTSNGDYALFSASQNSIIARTDGFEIEGETGFQGNSSGTDITSIAPGLGHVAIGSPAGLTILDFGLDLVANLNDLFDPGSIAGVAFSPTADQLFVLDAANDVVRAINTNDYSLSYWLDLSFDVLPRGLASDQPNLEFSVDGSALVVQNGLNIEVLSLAQMHDGQLVPRLLVQSGESTVAAIDGFVIDVIGNAFFDIADNKDGALFELDETTETLDFVNPPDMDVPLDSNGDNLYALDLLLTDAAGELQTQPIIVEVVSPDDLLSGMAATII